MSDIINDTICLNQEVEEPAFGAALIAGLGTNCFSHDSILNRKRTPDEYVFPSSNARLYAELYPMYKDLYSHMFQSFQRLHAIIETKTT